MFERFITFVALEWFFPSVLPHVYLQSSGSSASVVALVAFERLYSDVFAHYVSFQMIRCSTRVLAHRAHVWLFTRVRPLVCLQMA